ncbi:MAG: hypothetical protein ABI912_12235 [Actinomycetota bacterium]
MIRPRLPRRKSARVVIAVIGVLILPFALLFARWTVAVVRCGHQPIETSDFAAANSYTLPGDGTYSLFPVFNGFACDLSDVGGRQHSTLK